MKLSQFAALVAVADSGGFSKGAALLGVSQSAVSHAIAKLEAELGCTLLERGRTGARLTDCGREIAAHARTVVTHEERIRDVARSRRAGRHGGVVRFATSQSFAMHFLPNLLSRFAARFPHQEVELREGSDPQIAQWLTRQAVDVGVVTLPKEGMTTHPLWEDEMRLLLAHGHPLARARSVPVSRLDGEPLLMPVGGIETVIRAALRVAGVQPRAGHRLRDLNSLLAMVGEGIGVTILPTSALPALPAGVSSVALTPRVSRRVGLATTPDPSRQAAVAALVAIARELAAVHDSAAAGSEPGPAGGDPPGHAPTSRTPALSPPAARPAPGTPAAAPGEETGRRRR